MLDPQAEKKAVALIRKAQKKGDTLGGIIEAVTTPLPVGLGSFAHWEEKLNANLARAVMSIQAIKGVEIGLGFGAAGAWGSQTHDEIYYAPGKGYFRKTNRAGGIEGGMSNGMPLILRAAMKPISTLLKPLSSVNIRTRQAGKAVVERSDICAVPAAGVVCEAVIAIEVARAMREKFGGDSLLEMKRNFQGALAQIKGF
jgi:chorismate synthase